MDGVIKGGGDDGEGGVRGGLGWSHLPREVSTHTQTVCIKKCAFYRGQIKLRTALKWHEDGAHFINQALVDGTEMIRTLRSSTHKPIRHNITTASHRKTL